MNIKLLQNISDLLRSRREGFALPIVILVSALLLGLGLALSTNTILETGVSANNERSVVALYAAEVGLERAISDFRTNYTVTTVPANGAVLYNQTAVAYAGNTSNSDYTVTLSRRDSPAGSPISPFPIFYTIRSVGRQLGASATASASTAMLEQTVSVSPTTLAVYTLFYDQFASGISFQSTFKLSGSLAVNEMSGVRIDKNTQINGDFYAAGPIIRSGSWGVPKVSGNITENGGKIDFPTTVDAFTNDAVAPYKFTGTTRLHFNTDGTVKVYNGSVPGGSTVLSMPPNGLIAVSGGDAIVEGTVKGRVTVTGTDDVLVNGDIRYADQSSASWDTLALVANEDIVIPTNYYTGGDPGQPLRDFEPVWSGGHTQANSISGGTWGAVIDADIHVDATLVALTGSAPSVIAPTTRARHEFCVYGNDISKIASVTIKGDLTRGLNEQYTENKKLAILPPPGFKATQKLTPTFMTFREIRTALGA
jgi:Tfp pilus assembly protein PilX